MNGIIRMCSVVAFCGATACVPIGDAYYYTEIHGVISDSDGEPIVGAMMYAFGPRRCEDPQATGIIDSAQTGPGGTYSVTVYSGYDSGRCRSKCTDLRVTPGSAHQFDTVIISDVPVQLCLGGTRTEYDITIE